jgi:hypothetical protein
VNDPVRDEGRYESFDFGRIGEIDRFEIVCGARMREAFNFCRGHGAQEECSGEL